MHAVKHGREITTQPAPKPDQGSRILYTGAEERTCQRVPELGRPVEKKGEGCLRISNTYGLVLIPYPYPHCSGL